MGWFIAGIVFGVLIAAPVALYLMRRTEARVKTLERRAQSAERLAELGTLTGGLAHEIKNPLSTIGLNLQLLRESIGDLDLPDHHASRLLNRLDAVTGESDRLREILEDFLSFAGRVRLDPQPHDVNELIMQLVDFYNPQADASGVQLRTKLSPATGAARVDRTLLKQALLNLLINATQAMVEARYADKPHGGSTDLIIRSEPVDEDSIALHVIDTGPGIDPDVQAKIFRPYFTTKKGGTGLGLATTRRIIEEHGGSVTVHSEAGRGSDFQINLPRQGPRAADES
ncbi:MAG: two-component sensor histidine kinase [Phycisphaera sp.]|nr:two-component sensor histidine kinase [Phycisphaera sp.]